jgi:hypothetical protein
MLVPLILKMIFNFNLKDMPGAVGPSIRRRTTACDQDYTVGIRS